MFINKYIFFFLFNFSFFLFRNMNLYILQRLNNNYVYIYILFCGYLINVCFSKILTNSYLIEFHQPTDRSLADQIASRHGFINAGSVSL